MPRRRSHIHRRIGRQRDGSAQEPAMCATTNSYRTYRTLQLAASRSRRARSCARQTSTISMKQTARAAHRRRGERIRSGSIVRVKYKTKEDAVDEHEKPTATATTTETMDSERHDNHAIEAHGEQEKRARSIKEWGDARVATGGETGVRNGKRSETTTETIKGRRPRGTCREDDGDGYGNTQTSQRGRG